LKKLDLVLAWMLVVLGFVHCGAGIVSAAGLKLDSIWFFAGGIAIVEGGFLNILRNGGGRGMARVASILANVLLLLVVVAISIVVLRTGRFLANPQVILALFVVGAETLFSIA
jgi:hypothetical protein